MRLTKCENNHYYDGDQFTRCPYCGVKIGGKKTKLQFDDDVTIAMPDFGDDEKTIAMDVVERDDDLTVAKYKGEDDDDLTVSYYSEKYKGEPTVGWLVCTKGAEMGRDYRLHSSKNFVGRASGFDIAIFDDQSISRSISLIVIFDPKTSKFFVSPGDIPATLNGKQLKKSTELKDSDVISVGDSELTFIAFCKEDRKW